MTTNKLPKLSQIVNIQNDPMDMFKIWFDETKKYKSYVEIMNLATVNSEFGVLNRSIGLRKFNENGFMFMTTKKSRKYADMKANPMVAATFFWNYKDNSNQTILKQIRINGTVQEIDTPSELNAFYAEETLHCKIRIKLTESEKPVADRNELKQKHEQLLLNDMKNIDFNELFQRDANYVIFKIIPKDMEFYMTEEINVGDRIRYIKDCSTNKWKWNRVI